MVRNLDDIPAYVQGKSVAGACKLSSNESGFSPLPSVVEAVRQASKNLQRYPSMQAEDLRNDLGRYLDIEPWRIVVGCGSSALCQQLVQIACAAGEEVVFPWRSFEAYPIFARVAGARPVPVPLRHEALDLDAMLHAITPATRLIFVCNPNNPTGSMIAQEELKDFMDAVPDHVLVALDEAYIEFADTTVNSRLLLDDYPNLVCLRTFSKAFGLAGLRVGYAFGAEKVIEALNKVAIPFAVSTVAQAAARASLKEMKEIGARVAETRRARAMLVEGIPGACASQANFVWVPGSAAEGMVARLAAGNILVREFPEGVRITATDCVEASRVLTALHTRG